MPLLWRCLLPILSILIQHGHLISGFSPCASARQATPSCLRAQPTTEAPSLDAKQLDFCRGYLNKHHRDLLCTFAEMYSELGVTKSKRNTFSGGSFKIEDSEVKSVSPDSMELEVTIHDRKVTSGNVIENIIIPLDADLITKKRGLSSIPQVPAMQSEVDTLVRRLVRLCNQVNRPDVTGKLIQMGIQFGSTMGEVKENLFLNQVPHNRYVRSYFYDMASEALMEAVVMCANGEISNRMKITSMFPELNPSMDSYRIGTLLELARTLAIRLAEENLRVRVCVQGSMGVGIFTGLPKQLNGVAQLLQRMDWQSGEGEMNEGMVGNYVNFGAIGKEHVVNTHKDIEGNTVEQDDVFILLCPQSTVGLESSIIKPLQEMVEAAGDRPVVLINPDLTDKISSQGQQSVRGRRERIEFADSFKTVFHFGNLYVSGTSYFPILGSVTKLKPSEPWVAHQRRDRLNNEGEVYVPVVASEEKPSSEAIKEGFAA